MLSLLLKKHLDKYELEEYTASVISFKKESKDSRNKESISFISISWRSASCIRGIRRSYSVTIMGQMNNQQMMQSLKSPKDLKLFKFYNQMNIVA